MIFGEKSVVHGGTTEGTMGGSVTDGGFTVI